MATSLADYIQQLYQPAGGISPGFRLGDLSLREGDLVSQHNLQTRGIADGSLPDVKGTSYLNVASQRLGLTGQQIGLNQAQVGLDRAGLGLDSQQTGLDRQQLGLNREGVQAQMSRAQRDFKIGRASCRERV